MDEMYDIVPTPDDRDTHKPLLAQWLDVLLKIQIAAVAVSLLAMIPGVIKVTQWVSPLLAVGVIVALFRLTPVSGRYRKAAIFRCVTLAGTVLALFNINALSLVTSVCAIVASYQEYAGHSEVTNAAPALSRRWHSLFYWQLVVGILSGFGAVAGTVIAVLVGVGSTAIINGVVVVIAAVSVVMQIVYVLYLKKTLELFRF